MDDKTSKNLTMPKEAYMMYKKKDDIEACFLLIEPWDFKGIGMKDNEEYWVLGAQFL